jgi:hypothetical protein
MKLQSAIIIAILNVIFGWSYKGIAQTVKYVTLYNNVGGTNVPYPLMTNQIIALVGTYNLASPGFVIGNAADGTQIKLPYPSTGPFQIFTGLTNISLLAENIAECATLQITTPCSGIVVSNYVPADAIVIPASTTGNVQIILESSIDLVNWTAANPGTYSSSSATNRFFRVRAAVN